MISLLALATAVAFAAPLHAGSPGFDHAAEMARVGTYDPIEGFNEIVGGRRFVGYFLKRGETCQVSLFVADAGDIELVKPVERMTLTIPAADRAEVPAADGGVLAIGCTIDADSIKVVPLTRPLVY